MNDNQILYGLKGSSTLYATTVVDWARAAKNLLGIEVKNINIDYEPSTMEVFLDSDEEDRIMGYSGHDEEGDE